jgi:transposase
MKATIQVPERVQRKFDPAFKAQAVQNWMESTKSAEVIGRELGIDPNRLYAWRKQFGPRIAATSKPPSITDLQHSLEELRRENRHLREQRDILKKTLGILSEPSATASNGSTR